jgi:hypothetical protein
MPLPYFYCIEVVFQISDMCVLLNFHHQDDIKIEETYFTLMNLSNMEKNQILPLLREVRLNKLLYNSELPIRVVITYYDRAGRISKRCNYKTNLDSDLTFNIRRSKIETF